MILLLLCGIFLLGGGLILLLLWSIERVEPSNHEHVYLYGGPLDGGVGVVKKGEMEYKVPVDVALGYPYLAVYVRTLENKFSYRGTERQVSSV